MTSRLRNTKTYSLCSVFVTLLITQKMGRQTAVNFGLGFRPALPKHKSIFFHSEAFKEQDAAWRAINLDGSFLATWILSEWRCKDTLCK